MARRCSACGGVLGLDCFNEQDCLMITQNNYQYDQQEIADCYRQIEILKNELIKNNIPIPDLSHNVPAIECNNDDLPF